MRSPLEDLDELILRCRDEKARSYIAEAVSSYRVGAFRSSIVASWVAVCFDIIEKLRELALAGDPEAEKQVLDLETTRKTGDLSRALKFERGILELAKDKFELLSPLEFIDLERLQNDRNRCAHPSLTSDDQAYLPSAELARLHIHSAVTHMLQHPPVQGKYALERLKAQIESDYFPSDFKEALIFFQSGPLRRPRNSLVRNILSVLIKILLNERPQWQRRRRLTAAFGAICAMHLELSSRFLGEKLNAMFRTVEDTNLMSTAMLLLDMQDLWQYLEPDVRQRLENYVGRLPSDQINYIDDLLNYPHFREQAKRRVNQATREELHGSLFLDTPVEVLDRWITIYLNSFSREEANKTAKQMTLVTSEFNVEHIHRLLHNISKNKYICESLQLGQLISNLRSRNKISTEEFEQILEHNGLNDFTLKSYDQDMPF
ncbi:MAG: hypothetical protein EOO64_03060 [Massilia sp.]|nr:MAG: hypothetical protein EOO64_03060 [Massilia sp.]